MKKVTVKFNFSSIIWGIILVAAGVIFALNSLEITNVDIFFKGWWTLFIIIPCTVSLVTDRYLENVAGNLCGIAIGVFLLLCARGILEYSMIWKLLLPAFIVIAGLKMLFGGIFSRKYIESDDDFDDDNDDEDDNDDDDEENNGEDDGEGELVNTPKRTRHIHRTSAVFSVRNVNFDGSVFDAAAINVIFGGVQLDLRKAIIEGDCKIHSNCIFGGVTILVPENVNVKINDSSIFGGSVNKTRHHKGAPTIYIHNNTIFGGITVKE